MKLGPGTHVGAMVCSFSDENGLVSGAIISQIGKRPWLGGVKVNPTALISSLVPAVKYCSQEIAAASIDLLISRGWHCSENTGSIACQAPCTMP